MTQALRQYYPPTAKIDDLHRHQSVSASTPEEAAHLAKLGWIAADVFDNARRQTEKAAVKQAEKEAQAAAARARHEAELKAVADAERAAARKASEDAEAQSRAKLTAYEQRVDFHIRAAKAQEYPLFERRREINLNLVETAQRLPSATDEERFLLAQKLLDLKAEGEAVSVKLEEIGIQLQAEMEAARSCLS